MASGYLQNASTGALDSHQGTAGVTFAAITLTTHTERGSLSMPSGGVRWSHFEIILDDDAVSTTIRTIQVFFSWDSAGDDICAGPSSVVEMVRGQTDTSRHMAAVDMDMVPVFPADGAADTIYAWVNTTNFNDTTANLVRARLYWHELSKG